MHSYQLFLDDERQPKDVTWLTLPGGTWYIARCYEDFIEYVQEYGAPTFVSFDHDLGDEPPYDGASCARYLAEWCIDHGALIPPCAIHSKNPVGEANIRSIMESASRVQAGEESSDPTLTT